MYAIAFDMDTKVMEDLYPGANYNNGYIAIRKFLRKHGFGHQQGTVYFGDETVTAVTTVLTIQALVREFPWFHPSVRDIRMLKIEENNDLRVVVDLEAARTLPEEA
jgi:virulence-associated protein VapD